MGPSLGVTGDEHLDADVSRSSIVAITAVTDPIRSACVLARSPRSAKKSMKTKMTPEMKKSTTQRGLGMMPTAP